MTSVADSIRVVLVPFLMVTGTVLLLLVCHVLILHGVREVVFRRRRRLIARYRPLLDAVLYDEDCGPSLARLQAAPRRHRSLIAGLTLEPLRALKGPITSRARAAAEALGLLATWEAGLSDRRWWVRADAAHALGLVRHARAVPHLIAALHDPYEDVRAAAIEALGRIGDPAAIPELVSRLPEQSRHQRVRIVEALQQFGWRAVPPLLGHADGHPEDLALVAELLATIEAPAAMDTLLTWITDPRPDVRTSALRAIGAIGVDERAYYHVLRALTDEAADVRAAAAWALGRSGREEAAAYLAPRLRDEWVVAAESARALRDLGACGRRELEAAAVLEQGELARQMLWEAAGGVRT